MIPWSRQAMVPAENHPLVAGKWETDQATDLGYSPASTPAGSPFGMGGVLLAYLKLTGFRLGLLINFGEELLKNGIKRLAK